MVNCSRLFMIAVAALSLAAALGADPVSVKLNVGDKAPAFAAKDADGNDWSSADHVGKKFIVLYFYPAAMTGGCTKQACSYRDDLSQFRQAGAEVVGVSGDEVENLKAFQKVENLNFTLLSDPDGSIAKKFGVPLRDGGSINKTVDGQDKTFKRGVTASRWTFIIDQNGNVAYVNPQVDAQNDSKAVMAALEGLKK
ncbi:MAG: peroxiredoxin [Acidobacteria bacterium]|nr:MAG: peroxiredoxin [Acidobacteriota bacterium]